MNAEEMLSFLNDVDEKLCHELEGFKRIPYGEFVGAPYPYCCQGDLTFGDPDLDMIYDIHEKVNNYLNYLKSCTATLASNSNPFDDNIF